MLVMVAEVEMAITWVAEAVAAMPAAEVEEAQTLERPGATESSWDSSGKEGMHP